MHSGATKAMRIIIVLRAFSAGMPRRTSQSDQTEVRMPPTAPNRNGSPPIY